MATQTFRITYATMKADNEDLQAAYDRGIETARSWLGQRHPFYVNGESREGESWFEERSPIDHDIMIGTFAQASCSSPKVVLRAMADCAGPGGMVGCAFHPARRPTTMPARKIEISISDFRM